MNCFYIAKEAKNLKKRKKIVSSHKGGFLGILILFSLLLLISEIALVLKNQHYQKLLVKKNAIKVCEHVKCTLEDCLDDTSFILSYLSQQIIIHKKHKNLQSIYKLFHELSPKRDLNFFSWTALDWVSPSFKLFVGGDPLIFFDMSDREYIHRTQKLPGVFQIGNPCIGKASKKRVIPAGIGVKKNELGFLGTVIIALDINKLAKALECQLGGEWCHFTVINLEGRVIFDSSRENEGHFLKDPKLFQLITQSTEEGELDLPIDDQQKKSRYTYFKRLKKYPYIILTGYDVDIQKRDLYTSLLFHGIKSLLFILFFIILAVYYRKKFVFLSEFHDKKKREFYGKINQNISLSIDKICQHCTLLMASYSQKEAIHFIKRNQEDYIDNIKKIALGIQKFSMKALEKKNILTNKILEDVISAHSHTAFIKNISFTASLEKNLPNVYCNEFFFRQIVVSLLNYSFETTPSGGKVILQASAQKKEKETMIKITVSDSGFFLSEKDVERIAENLNLVFNKNDHWYTLSLDMITDILETLGGEVFVHKEKSGKKIYTFIPLRLVDD